MSTLASASVRGRTTAWSSWIAHRLTAEALLGLGLVAGLGTVTFVAGGGTALGSNTWTEIALAVAGTVLAAVVVLAPAGRPAWGTTALLLFIALAAWTAVSIAWSVQPANSWVEANQVGAYVAAFGGAIALARLLGRCWSGVIGAVTLVAFAVCAYALLVKVFPATLDPSEVVGRLRLPFDYPTAVGQLAAMGVPGCLWLGARSEGSRISRALAVPALGLLSVAMVLSYSRGALLIAAVGVIVWLVLVPLRLRAALVLVLGTLGGAAATAWALSKHPLTHDYSPLVARTSAGHSFGLVLLAMLVLQTIAGFVAAQAVDRTSLSEPTRRRVGAALVTLVAVMALAGIGAVAASSRGLAGTVSDAWNQLTSPNSSGAAEVPGRLLALGSSRGRYWNEGLTVGRHSLLKGVGAGGFATAHRRYYRGGPNLYVQNAHSYVIETFADLGLVGVALSLALLIAWALAAGRTVGRPRRGPPTNPERIGLITMLTTVITFGLGSAIDWTWLIPGTALPALICAGWLAGRGPVHDRDGGGRFRRPSPGAIFALTAIVVGALAIVWAMAQPLRSANADAAALTAITKGNTGAAFADARAAASEDPVSVDPLFELAAFDRVTGNDAAAVNEIRRAVALQPDNPATWLQEGELLLAIGRPGQSLPALTRAAQLDLGSTAAASAIARAKADLAHATPTVS